MYSSVKEFLADLRKMFRNCLKFHEKGSEFYNHGKCLEETLDRFLEQWLPEFAYESFEGESFKKKKFVPRMYNLFYFLHDFIRIQNAICVC